jgi:1-acyl-sn-glycerol-3-phosphate acyltransferase
MPESYRPLFRHFADWVLGYLFRILMRIEVVGAENVPSSGPFIVMMNHIFFLDPVLIGVFCPRTIIIMSKIENYDHPLLAAVQRLYGTFPVHRGQLDLQAIRRSLAVLESGTGLLIAPEGTRSRSRTLQPGREGAMSIAWRADVPIVPVAVTGQERLWSSLKRLGRTSVRLVFGEPFELSSAPGLSRRQQLRSMTDEAMYRLSALLPPDYRGVYADVQGARCQFTVTISSDTDRR